MPEMLLVVVILGFVVWLVVRLVNQAAPRSSLDQRERDELTGLRDLVDDLKETAWEHRELDSPLSTIVIDKIRSYERSRRESA